ncbi:MAG: type II toxin-antitoxin system PemK/MazF family toxin [Novosphingobium sp.]
MKRGEIWTLSGGPGFASKPRPALIVQSDLAADTPSVLTCGFTTQASDDVPLRPLVLPSAENGLARPSNLMSEKITAVPRTRLGRRVGALSGEEMARADGALQLVMGFAE